MSFTLGSETCWSMAQPIAETLMSSTTFLDGKVDGNRADPAKSLTRLARPKRFELLTHRFVEPCTNRSNGALPITNCCRSAGS